MNEVSILNFRDMKLRITAHAGTPWFVAKDLAVVLGYSDTQAMTRRLDDEDVMSCTDKLSGQARKVNIVNESGLYCAILGSKKPEARDFKRWVTTEVLPSIRESGVYVSSSPKRSLVSKNGNSNELVQAISQVLTPILEQQNKILQLLAQQAIAFQKPRKPRQHKIKQKTPSLPNLERIHLKNRVQHFYEHTKFSIKDIYSCLYNNIEYYPEIKDELSLFRAARRDKAESTLVWIEKHGYLPLIEKILTELEEQYLGTQA